ncbi:DUF305 domain-containing protein [Streptomyces sp. NPDC048604]|uniref:DUF305 domain-containing protein n=1 Tax=Streptomyces sp. NPDC048604 TaxID=3365578 RepID=UPI00371F8CD8
MSKRPVRTAALASAGLLAVLLLAGCDSGPSEAAPQAGKSTGAGVIAPGRPGEAARTLSPQEAARALPDERPNTADRTYAQMMIVHHRQALTMTALVPERAGSDQVKKLAARITAAQQPEIAAMEGWLKTNGAPAKQGGHDHGTMPGMATDAQLAQLKAARGEAFDDLFLKLMITHHDGALTMAAEVLSEGNNVLVEEMANDVIAQQTAEINRMRSM